MTRVSDSFRFKNAELTASSKEGACFTLLQYCFETSASFFDERARG